MELERHAKKFAEVRNRISHLPEETRDTLVALADRAEESLRAIRELKFVCEDELTSARLIALYREFDSEARRREAIERRYPSRQGENRNQGIDAKPRGI